MTVADSNTAIRASICIAAYRGERFIGEQLRSILEQLSDDDEVIVVDDSSPDATGDVVSTWGDKRIRLIRHETNRGYVRAFETAVGASRGEYIFLSDQDDIWVPGRLDAMLAALHDHEVVASNFAMYGGADRPWIPRLSSRMDGRHWANLLGILVGVRAYYGCGMAFRRDILPLYLPIPGYVHESHDLWLAICGTIARSLAHLESDTLQRRVHGENQTPLGFRSLPKILSARIMFLRLILEARRRRAVSPEPSSS